MSSLPLPAFLPPGILPGAFDLVAMAAMAGTFLALMLAGRLVTAGRVGVGLRVAPLLDLAVGWGVLALLLTLWGTLTTVSMVWPALLVPLAAALALLRQESRPDALWWRTLGRTLGLGLPLIVIMSGTLPGEVDTFLYWLPSAAYLHDHGMFPADNRLLSFAPYPAHPYNVQFITFVAGLVLPDFVRAAPIQVNVLLNILFVGLLAQLVEACRGRAAAAPRWGVLALLFFVALPLNPAFLPEFNLSSYGESTIGITLALATLAALALRERVLEREPSAAIWRAVAVLALALAALVDIKQTSIVFSVGVAIGLGVLLWRDGVGLRRSAGIALLALLPTVVEHAAWRIYVMSNFVRGENVMLPRSQWHLDEIDKIIASIIKESLEKGYFTLLVLIVLAVTARAALAGYRARRAGRPPSPAEGRTEAGLLMATWAYVLNFTFLFTMYVIQFPGVLGPNAQSFYRYCTQNGPLFLMALVPVAAGLVAARPHLLARLRGLAGGPGFGWLAMLWLVVPLISLFYIRYDQRMPVPLLWSMAEALSVPAKAGTALAIVVPSGDQQERTQVTVALQVTTPRRADLRYEVFAEANDEMLASLRQQGFDRVLLSCVPAGLARFGTGGAVVLAPEGEGWTAIARHAFPDMNGPGIWRPSRAEKLTRCRG